MERKTKKLEILVVEDNPENLKNVIECFTEKPYIKRRRMQQLFADGIGSPYFDAYIRSRTPSCDKKTEDGYNYAGFEEQTSGGEVYEIVLRTATTYDEASRILRENGSIATVITDMNFPRSEGKEPEQLGYDLIDRELEPRGINYAVVTLLESQGNRPQMVYVHNKEQIDSCRKEGRPTIGRHGTRGVTVKTEDRWNEALGFLLIQAGIACGIFESGSMGIPEYREPDRPL